MRAWHAFLILAGAAIAAVPLPATAALEGPCRASLDGRDFAGHSIISIDQSTVEYTFESTNGQTVRFYELQIHYGPASAAPASEHVDSDRTAINGTLNLRERGSYGVGAYRLTGHALLADGTRCDVDVQVVVRGNPLATPAGQIAASVAVISTSFLIAVWFRPLIFV